jgi:hypothetical protein
MYAIEVELINTCKYAIGVELINPCKYATEVMAGPSFYHMAVVQATEHFSLFILLNIESRGRKILVLQNIVIPDSIRNPVSRAQWQ